MITKILHIKLRVTVPDQPPQEMIDTYIKGVMKSPDKGYKRLKEVIPDIEAVIEKIIKPGLKGPKDLFKPEAFTRRGTKIKDSLRPDRADMVKWAKRWFKKTKHAYRYQGKEHAEMMKYMAEYWGKTMLPTLAIRGYQDKIRGVGPVASRWLTGDLTVVPPEDGSGANFRVASGDKRISREEIIEGGPIDITQPGQRGKFRNRFLSQITSSGSQIIERKDQPGEIIYGNREINRLVNDYARDEFVPFTPGGLSHIDFIRETGELFLDVQVSIK